MAQPNFEVDWNDEHTFDLFVYCRKNNVSRDSGLHATKSGQLKDVLPLLRKDAEWLLQSYDEIHCTVVRRAGKKQVAKYTLRTPRRDDMKRHYDNIVNGRYVNHYGK